MVDEGATPRVSSRGVVMSRRTHVKSRSGCTECKRRRIKRRSRTYELWQCNETRPSCGNCLRRSTNCIYTSNNVPTSGPRDHSSSVASSSNTVIDSSSSTPIHTPIDPPALALPAFVSPSAGTAVSINASAQTPDLFQLELWHHWLITVCKTFPDDESGVVVWREKIPQFAFRHSYVAQLLLVLSALHLGRSQVSRHEMCASTSTALQSSAIDGMMAGLAAISNNDGTNALFVASMLLCFCNMAKGPQPGQYLLYSDSVEPEWLGLLQVVKSMREQNEHVLVDLSGDETEESFKVNVKPDAALPGFDTSFRKLKSYIDGLCVEDTSFAKYSRPVDDLQTCCTSAFWCLRGYDTIAVRSPMVFAWLYRLNADYLTAVQEGKPMALVIYAYYIVLVAQIQHCWYLHGWVDHIMADIRRRLHPAYMHWMEWPSSAIGHPMSSSPEILPASGQNVLA